MHIQSQDKERTCCVLLSGYWMTLKCHGPFTVWHMSPLTNLHFHYLIIIVNVVCFHIRWYVCLWMCLWGAAAKKWSVVNVKSSHKMGALAVVLGAVIPTNKIPSQFDLRQQKLQLSPSEYTEWAKLFVTPSSLIHRQAIETSSIKQSDLDNCIHCEKASRRCVC